MSCYFIGDIMRNQRILDLGTPAPDFQTPIPHTHFTKEHKFANAHGDVTVSNYGLSLDIPQNPKIMCHSQESRRKHLQPEPRSYEWSFPTS